MGALDIRGFTMNILDLLARHALHPKRVSTSKGGEYASPCPACGGEDRFRCWPEQKNGEGSWWCRGCDKGGDCISFLREFDGMSFQEAARTMGREIEARPAVSTPMLRSHRQREALLAETVTDPKQIWQDRARALVEQAHKDLLASPEKMEWLAARGISAKTVCRFKLGWNKGERGRDIFRPRESWGLEPVMKEDGRPKKMWIPIGLTIPLFDGDKVLRVRIRRDEGEPRYFVLPGSASDPIPCLCVDSAWTGPHQAVIVCESELDGILLAQEAGDLVGVLALGSASAKPRDAGALAMATSAAWIGLWLDRDAAGDKAMAWWLEEFPGKVQDIRPPQDVKDPGDYAREVGPVREHMLGTLPPAWRLPTSGAESAKQGGRGALEESEKQSRRKVAASVAQFGRLLQKYPVVCRYADDGIGIRAVKFEKGKWVEDVQWMFDNKEIADRIWRLFWHDDDVDRYLDAHPDREQGINGRNFWKGLPS